MLGLDGGQPLDHSVDRLQPRGLDEIPLTAHQRLTEARLAVDVLEPESPSHTDAAVPLCRLGSVPPLVLPGQGRGNTDHFVVLGLDVHLAAVPAVVASCRGLFELPRLVQILGILVRDRTDRADRQAVAAKLTGERDIALGHDLGEAVLLHELKGINHQHVFAYVDALATGDAAVHVEIQDEASGVLRNQLLLGVGQGGHLVLEGHVLQLAMAVCIADRTIQRVDGQMFLDRLFSGLKQVVPLGAHHHAGRGFRGAGANRRLFPLYHDQTDSAGAEGVKRIVVTHGRHDVARAGNHIVERDPVFSRHGPAVKGQLDRRRFDVRVRRWFQSHSFFSVRRKE